MKISDKIDREFEIPYQFNPDLITGLQILDIPSKRINCFYMAPYPLDYETIIRTEPSNKYLLNLSKKDYIQQIEYINEVYPNKLQLLLQRIDNNLMTKEKLQFYYNLGFRKFCIGNPLQGQIIKDNFDNVEIIGSITMHINKDKIEKNPNYKNLFNGFVLDFSYCRHLDKIKDLPINYNYILLVNSWCNSNCDGDRHWWSIDNFLCPGLIKQVGFLESCLIRPMDLYMFDPYIQTYKLQDRSWPIDAILRDLILYTTQYNFYDGIVYSSKIYNKKEKIKNDL